MLAGVALVSACSAGSASSSARPAPVRVGSTSGHARASLPATLHARTRLRLPVGVSRTVVLASGQDLLVLGGLAPGDTTTARVWRIDPKAGHVSRLQPLTQAVHDASGAMLGGRAYVFGGGAATTVASVQRWSAGTASVSGRLPQPRSDSAAAVIGSTAYVVGGFSGSGMTRDVLATTDGHTFRVVGKLAVGVRYPAVTAVGTAVYVVGGALATTEGTASGAQTAAVQRFDPATGRVKVVGALPHPIAHAMAFAHAGELYIAGGRRGAVATDAVVRFDVRTAKTAAVGRLPHALSDAGVAQIGGVVWLVGGETAGPGEPSSAVMQLVIA